MVRRSGLHVDTTLALPLVRTLQHTPPAAARGRARSALGPVVLGRMRGWADHVHDPGERAAGSFQAACAPGPPFALSALCGGSGTRPDAIRDPIVYEN